jgi:hypothetical protein
LKDEQQTVLKTLSDMQRAVRNHSYLHNDSTLRQLDPNQTCLADEYAITMLRHPRHTQSDGRQPTEMELCDS